MLELDPFDSLALTLHHAPGASALLIGSGLSRAAGIPTGWEITLDLVRRVAVLKGEDTAGDPAAWYAKTYGEEPNYSVLLDALASTPAERRAVLHTYIEPQGEGAERRPTAAHHSIARLVASGSLRVIVTTNFDRLLEQALVAAGVEPTVISSDDTLAGAVPLIHARCTVLKLHGDYLDTRIRNIDTELSSYTPAMDRFLDQIFDTFGLIVCGWSGEWDTALRAAVIRAPGRRYPTYWAAFGEPAALAMDLIHHRGARVVSITGGDPFFMKLGNTIDALREANRPHPTSVQLLVTQARRTCSDDSHAIAWADLLVSEAEAVRQGIEQSGFYSQSPTDELGKKFVAELVTMSERLRRMFMVCGRWGTARARSEAAHTLLRLVVLQTNLSGFAFWNSLRNVPAMLCFYWYGIGAVASSDFKALMSMFAVRTGGKQLRESLLETLPPLVYDSVGGWKFLNGETSYRLPASQYFGALIQNEVVDIARSAAEGDILFDDFETLVALESAHLRNQQMSADNGLWFWTPMGKFVWRRDDRRGLENFESLSVGSEYLAAGLFGGKTEAAKAAVEAVKVFISKANLNW